MKKPHPIEDRMGFSTDRVRFELTIPLRVRQFSRLVPSTTRPPILSAFTIGALLQSFADISRVRPFGQWEFAHLSINAAIVADGRWRTKARDVADGFSERRWYAPRLIVRLALTVSQLREIF